MSDHLGYDDLRADTVRQVAKLMAAAAITAPKSGGQLFLQGKHLFVETVIVDDHDTLARLANWMRARGKERREAELEFAGPQCNLRDIDLGIAVGSAAKTAAIHSVDCRCQTRIAVAARKLGVIRAEIAVALSLSLTHKSVGFDRKMPEVDFDALDLPPTNTLPIGVEGAARLGGARNRQQPRRPLTDTATNDRR